ncbi:type II toxin-antitoxin system HicB family antitoxin [Alicyclobacillus suci]|uniref:type II toxin-antitoxin system HicB family antitoxin n=1 Tax=Alicyclobacillus suci TaxID=2816080 RepID=UPI001A8D8F0B|nr:type II toxin-antitoxin system HicB family antitoxin [Alicyclobacillus suci]
MSKLPDRYVYPAVFTFEDDGVSVEFPDLEGCFTGGADLMEATRLAKDVLAGFLSILEEDGDPIPPASTGENFDVAANQRVMLIEAWMPPYRDNYMDKSVNKTVTLPRWLKTAAEERHVNFSRVLQEALMHHLGIEVPRFSDDVTTGSNDGDSSHTEPAG